MSNCNCNNQSRVTVVDGDGSEYTSSVDIDGVTRFIVPSFQVSSAAGNLLTSDGFVPSRGSSVVTEYFSKPGGAASGAGVLFDASVRVYCSDNVSLENLTSYFNIPFFSYSCATSSVLTLEYAVNAGPWEVVCKRNVPASGSFVDFQSAGLKSFVASCSSTGNVIKYRGILTNSSTFTYGNIDGNVVIRKDILL